MEVSVEGIGLLGIGSSPRAVPARSHASASARNACATVRHGDAIALVPLLVVLEMTRFLTRIVFSLCGRLLVVLEMTRILTGLCFHFVAHKIREDADVLADKN